MKAAAGSAAEAFAKSGLLGLLEALDRKTDRVRVVAYHRIGELGEEPDLDPGLVSATPDEFRVQVELVARHYSPISLDDLVAAHRGERSLPPRAVLFTFDDGYRDFAEHAWPILERAGVPAVLFVPTAFPDRPGPGFWWDRLHAALARTDRREIEVGGIGRLPLGDAGEKRAAHRAIRTRVKELPHEDAMEWLDETLAAVADVPSVHRVLGWDALRALARQGLAVCAHGHVHALTTRLAPDALAEDLAISKRRIEEELGEDAPPPVFAYPSGAEDARSRRAVADAGFELGFGGRRSIDRLPFQDPACVMRLPMLNYASALFRAQLRPSVATLGRWLIDERQAKAA
ncbi:MAG: polysaccharide deacetylase family protein [Myxococcota bacterium]